MLNACNSRFLNPRLVGVLGRNNFPDNAEPAPKVAGPSFLQIGTEGGYLPGAVPVNGPKQLQLLIAPAERADLVVDFTGIPPGTEFILYNDAPGPYPGGASIFDYYPGNPKTPASVPGFGPNTRTLLKVRVIAGPGSTPLPASITLPFGQPYGDPPLVTQTPGVPIIPTINRNLLKATVPAPGGGTQTVGFRSLTLNEGFDEYGRLAQFLGTNIPTNPGFFGNKYLDNATEVVGAGDTEVWEIANLTADTHPIHFHLVNVQILARQAFSVKAYNGTPNFMQKPIAPDLNELGWKETVRMNPGEVIWVIMKFDLPVVPFTVPGSPRFNNSGNEYVWHCHILEHEEHDMMRPLVVT
jgi:spore coat protein A